MNPKQKVILLIMILSILLVISLGIGAITLFRRSGHANLKITVKTIVIAILILFCVLALNIMMLGVSN